MPYSTWSDTGIGIMNAHLKEDTFISQVKYLQNELPDLMEKLRTENDASDNEILDKVLSNPETLLKEFDNHDIQTFSDDMFESLERITNEYPVQMSGCPSILRLIGISVYRKYHLILNALDDFDGNVYLLYLPNYPWSLAEEERRLTPQSLFEIFKNVLASATDQIIYPEYLFEREWNKLVRTENMKWDTPEYDKKRNELRSKYFLTYAGRDMTDLERRTNTVPESFVSFSQYTCENGG